MANKERTVDLIVRAKDQFSKVLANLQKQQQEIANSGPGNLRKFYTDTTKAIMETEGAIKRLGGEFKALTQTEGDNRAAMGALLIEKMKLQAKAGELRASLAGVRAETQKLTGTQQLGFKAFNATATAMENEAAATRALTAAREAANARLRDMINTRLNTPVKSGFASWSSTAESNVSARQEADMSALMAKAYADRARETALMEQIQGRLNTKVKSGYADWSRYADTITRIAREEERSAAITARKAAIQDRLNNSVKSGYAAWSRSVDGLRAETTAANATATALKKVEVASNGAAAAQTRMAGATAGGRARGDTGGRKGESQDVEMYGLRPYQMVNLGYQVNDVISGLAMGQAPLQILSQQVGQFAQIWPQMMVGLVRSIPQIAALTAVFAPLIAAIARTNAEAQALAEFERQLNSFADGARYTSDALVQITKDFKQLEPFMKAGFEQNQLQGMLNLTNSVASITGDKFEDLAPKIAGAFSGGIGSIRELDKELNFLTASQYEQLLVIEQTRGAEAAAIEGQRLLAAQYASTAAQASGPWSDAWSGLADTWENLVGGMIATGTVSFATDVFNSLGAAIGLVASGLEAVTSLLPDPGTPGQQMASGQTDAQVKILELQQQQNKALRQRDIYLNGGANKAAAMIQTEIDLRAVAIAQAEEELRVLQQRNQATAMAYGPQLPLGPSEEDMKRQAEFLATLEGETEARMNEAAALSMAAQQQAVYVATLEMEARAKEANIEVTQAMRTEVEEGVLAYFRAEAAVKKLADAEKGAAAFTAEHQTESEKMVATISEMEGFIADLTAEYGANYPAVIAASEALARFRAEAASAYGKTVDLTSAAINLRNAMAGLGSFNADLDSQLIRVENQIKSLESGISEVRYNADEMVRKETDALLAAGATPDQIAKAYTELMPKAERLLTLEEQRAALVKSNFDPPKDSGGGGGSEKKDKEREAHEKRVNDLVSYRKALLEQIQLYTDTGNVEEADRLKLILADVNTQTVAAIDNTLAYLRTLSGPEIQAAIANLELMRLEIERGVDDLATKFLPTAESLNEQLSQIGSDAFGALAEAIANGKNVAQSFFDVLRQGIAKFLIAIGEAIVQQAIFNAISGGMAGGGIGGSISGMITGLFHSGGVVGRGAGSGSRMVSPSMFAGAQRFHSGGVLGLGPNEVPIIGLKDEEMLTRDDPRHVLNGGASGGGTNIKNVNVFNPADVMEAALATQPGEKVLINWMTRNARTINGALQI